jgi:GTP pyrophosphokinase
LLRTMSRQNQAGVVVGGVDDVLVRFGKCCEPLPGERILGFITRGRGVTVHAVDCPRVLDSDPQRRVEVVWEKGNATPRAVRATNTFEIVVNGVDELNRVMRAIGKVRGVMKVGRVRSS